MAFFVAKNENKSEFDSLMSAETLMKSAPDYYGPRFEAIADLRSQDDGTGHKGQEFRRVASFTNVPLLMAAKMVEPDFLKDKKKFYGFIDRHPEYVTYQRRGAHSRQEMARNALPLSMLGLDVPGVQWTETVHPIPDPELPAEATE